MPSGVSGFPSPHPQPQTHPSPAPIRGDNLHSPTNWHLTFPPVINTVLGEIYLHSHRISLKVRRLASLPHSELISKSILATLDYCRLEEVVQTGFWQRYHSKTDHPSPTSSKFCLYLP